MKLSEEEEEIILEHRRQEELKYPIKIGILKHDLYSINDPHFRVDSNYLITFSERVAIINKLSNSIKLDLPRGTKFDCYREPDGSEAWFDRHSGAISGADAEWAKEHLHKIKSVKKK